MEFLAFRHFAGSRFLEEIPEKFGPVFGVKPGANFCWKLSFHAGLLRRNAEKIRGISRPETPLQMLKNYELIRPIFCEKFGRKRSK